MSSEREKSGMSILSGNAVRIACVKSVYAWCGVSYFDTGIDRFGTDTEAAALPGIHATVGLVA